MEQIGESIKQAQEQRSLNIRHFKQFSMGIISTSLLVLDWMLLKAALFGGEPTSFWIWPALTTMFWIAAVSFFALINPNRITFFIFNVLGLIAFLAIMPRNLYIFLGGVIFFFLSMWFQRRTQEEEKNQLNFSIRRTVGNSQVIITYALLILVGFMIYSNIESDFKKDQDAFYKRLAETAVKGLPYVSQDRSKYNLSQTVGEFFRKQAENAYPNFNSVSSEQQSQLLNQIRTDFQNQFGVQANETESLRAAMTEVVSERLQEVLGKYERFFPVIFTVGILALLRTFAFIFNWITLLVTWIGFKILLGLKFFRLHKETIEVEKLNI